MESIAITVRNLEPAVAVALGAEPGIHVVQSRLQLDVSDPNDVVLAAPTSSQVAAVSESQIHGATGDRIHLRLEYQETSSDVMGSYSLDGGATYQMPFAPYASSFGALPAPGNFQAIGGEIRLPGGAMVTVDPYVADADTELLFSLDEPVGTSSSGLPDLFIVDDESAMAWNLRTEGLPFEGTAGPPGLATSARCDETLGLVRSINSDVTDLSLLETGTFTIEAWIHDPTPEEFEDRMSIFQASTESFSTIDQFLFFQLIEGPGADEQQLRFVFESAGGGAIQLYSDPFSTLAPDTWYHVAITYDDQGSTTANDSVVRFFLDSEQEIGEPGTRAGTLVGEVSPVGDVMPFDGSLNGDFFVGQVTIGTRRSLGGEIDEFRYSSVVRDTFNLVYVPEPRPVALQLIGACALGILARGRSGRARTDRPA